MNITYEDKVALIENEDIPDINKCNASDMNQIKKVVNSKANVIKLLTVNDVAPASCETGDKYYNTTDKVIYTAVGTNEWGTDGEEPIQGYVYLDVENSKLYCYDGTIFSSYGGGTPSEVVISAEEPEATEEHKIWIDSDEVNNLGSEVVDTLDGNETNKAPSVRAVNEKLEWKLVKKVVGNEIINLPEQFNELLAIIYPNNNVSALVTLNIPNGILETTVKGFNGGYQAIDTNAKCLARIFVTKTTAYINETSVQFNNNYVGNTSTLELYYR